MTRRIRIGIDTGGTFTDVVALDEDSGRARHDEDPLDTEQPGRRLPRGGEQGARPHGRERRRHHGRLARDDRRDQQAPRGQGRGARLHHDRGLRVHPRDRPPGGARRLRQLLLLGQAAAHRPRRPRQDGRWPDRLPGQRDPPLRRGPRRRGGPLVQGARHHDDRGLLPALLRPRRPRARDARRPAPRAPRRRRLDQLGGAPGVPRVRAVDDDPRRRRGEAQRVALRRQHPHPPHRVRDPARRSLPGGTPGAKPPVHCRSG